MVVLENSAGGGFGLGVDVAELAGIADALAARGVREDRVGFCLDTAHAWGAGIDLAEPEARSMPSWPTSTPPIGLERLVMIHLNDSKAELGSRLDRHEHLGAGRIGASGLAHLLCHPALEHVAYYLETPGMDEGYDAVNMARARDLMAGRPLATLPPEAMSVRGQPQPERTGGGPRRGVERGAREPTAVALAVPVRAAAARGRPAAAGPGDPGHLGRRPGSRHAGAAGARRRRGRAAAGATDLDRRRPPRRALLLPACAGGRADRRRFAAGRGRR